MGWIKSIKLLWKLNKLRRLIMSEIGDINQARIAAEKANSKVPDGKILVTPAKQPLASAAVETVSTGAAVVSAGAVTSVLALLFPKLDTSILGSLGVLLAFGINFGLKYLRKRMENAATPGVGVVK